ncbi:SUMF1/EgtB/PvdO family nonheme iron enzyme [Runella sp. MFBS21]|uniref:formylglycine-generating enzyme family protein n=1 Tax=Runella sp. MFBS21 TaxID=3034018 RepID=UPI0023F9583D|nr:SUMF1/EgtB/PvdO family nonheme iron enzyme [Runella sp. MFBS21]MDF7820374.1 SUMF1/EgtB/PvdO family nonheme iron enzyme [Runella sp. MFBS21]
MIFRISLLMMGLIWGNKLFAQKINFDEYKKRADACFNKQDYECAKENYERALRIRNEEPYCKSQLQKVQKALAKKTSTPVTPNPTPIKPKPTKPSTLSFVLVKGGTFQMGAPQGAVDEKPMHSVTLKDFYVATHEVTVAEYKQYCKATAKEMPTPPNWGWQDDHPIVGVSWQEAVEYCEWLSKQNGKKYRLLTEAEWEYAASEGPKKTAPEESGWYISNTDGASPKNVGTKKANKWGIFDMGGNAAEWCADWYDKGYYAQSPSQTPVGPAQGTRKVVRGRSFGDEPKSLTFRYALPPASKSPTVGFRICYEDK